MGLDWDFDVNQDEIELLAICIFILFLAYFLVYEICKRFGVCSCRQRKRNQLYQPVYSCNIYIFLDNMRLQSVVKKSSGSLLEVQFYNEHAPRDFHMCHRFLQSYFDIVIALLVLSPILC